MSIKEKTSRDAYHHGNLEEALVAAAISLIEENGVEGLSVREVAKRAGVSPGAPFRHFSSKRALLTAVAEQAGNRLTEIVQVSLAEEDSKHPLDGLRAIGRGYLAWVLAYPTHFQVVSSRTLIDFDASPMLVKENEKIRLIMHGLFTSAKEQGLLRDGVDSETAAEDFIFAARAFVYGLARMWIDGHFGEWSVTKPPAEAMNTALDLFIDTMKAE